jgi:hypothetical protein
MQVEREASASSGERVSNTWATYLQVRHNPGKPELIPYVPASYVMRVKIYRLEMGPRRIS